MAKTIRFDSKWKTIIRSALETRQADARSQEVTSDAGVRRSARYYGAARMQQYTIMPRSQVTVTTS